MSKINFIFSLLPWDITFERILQFNWSIAFRPITLEPEFCQICDSDLCRKINDNTSFHFKLFLGKNYHKIFQKIQKLYFGLNFPLKSALSVFKYSNYLTMVQKIRKKINNSFLSLMLDCWWTDSQLDRQTDRQTDGQEDRQTDKQTDREQWFYRNLHRTGVKKIKFGRKCNSHWGGKNNRKLNPFIKTTVNRSNTLFF